MDQNKIHLSDGTPLARVVVRARARVGEIGQISALSQCFFPGFLWPAVVFSCITAVKQSDGAKYMFMPLNDEELAQAILLLVTEQWEN